MESSALKLYILLLVIFTFGGVLKANDKSNLNHSEPELDEPAIIERIKNMTSEVVPPRYDMVVKSYLTTYTIKKRDKAENILGRQIIYFPLFEEQLRKAGLPVDLKYLSVVESALDPKAVSRVGATGLWQFMPATGKYYGLEINNIVDERSDPKRSTDAAIVYLSQLYERFNDWELAIAAYNSGGGRVSRAIKRSRSKNFWKVRRYLPRETRNYVPAFIAATYLIKHYQEHELIPRYPNLDMQLTETHSVYDNITFYEIAQVTGLPLDIIEALNPAYLQGFIPSQQKGYFITLPKRVMPAFKEYLDEKRPDYEARMRVKSIPVYMSKPNGASDSQYEKSSYTVLSGETIQSIANKIGCSVHQLKAWNNLEEGQELGLGQKLDIYVPLRIKQFDLLGRVAPLIPIGQAPFPENIIPQNIHNNSVVKIKRQLVESDGYLCYRLDRRERPFDVSLKLPFINYAVLSKLNGLKENKAMEAGTLLRVKKL